MWSVCTTNDGGGGGGGGVVAGAEPETGAPGKIVGAKGRHSHPRHHRRDRLCVMSYNLLAPSLVRLSSRMPEWVVRWEKRATAILEEVRRYRPSVACFQEVDSDTWGSLLKRLQGLGYDGVFKSRGAAAIDKVRCMARRGCACKVDCTNAVCNAHCAFCFVVVVSEHQHSHTYTRVPRMATNNQTDGVATLWLRARFLHLESKSVEYHVPGHRVMTKGNVGMVTVLQPMRCIAPRARRIKHHKGRALHPHASPPGDTVFDVDSVELSSHAPLIVANTHLLFNQKRGDIKLGQMRCVAAVVSAAGVEVVPRCDVLGLPLFSTLQPACCFTRSAQHGTCGAAATHLKAQGLLNLAYPRAPLLSLVISTPLPCQPCACVCLCGVVIGSWDNRVRWRWCRTAFLPKPPPPLPSPRPAAHCHMLDHSLTVAVRPGTTSFAPGASIWEVCTAKRCLRKRCSWAIADGARTNDGARPLVTQQPAGSPPHLAPH